VTSKPDVTNVSKCQGRGGLTLQGVYVLWQTKGGKTTRLYSESTISAGLSGSFVLVDAIVWEKGAPLCRHTFVETHKPIWLRVGTTGLQCTVVNTRCPINIGRCTVDLDLRPVNKMAREWENLACQFPRSWDRLEIADSLVPMSTSVINESIVTQLDPLRHSESLPKRTSFIYVGGMDEWFQLVNDCAECTNVNIGWGPLATGFGELQRTPNETVSDN
jgi:hypothetical protein